MNRTFLEFEKPIVELERKIDDLKLLQQEGIADLGDEIAGLEKKLKKLQDDIYGSLTRWQRVQLARHPARPYFLDYVRYITENFLEIHGDGCFRDDPAIICGLARIKGKSVVLIGQEKGRTTKEKIKRNFGMAHPEGYRKALKVARLAARFGKPLVCLVDTTGAYPGIGAEERGQAQAIAVNIKEFAHLPTPIIVVITGEGGSGGALGIGVGDVIAIMQYAYYSVISPEGCASILWRDASKAPEAAEALKVTAQDLIELGVVDKVIPEPSGGAHRNPNEAASILRDFILGEIDRLSGIPVEELVKKRIEKFQGMGVVKRDI
ncbi:acetyl-CoA carboxylase carboxyl transferase subunit alpha [candidate division WOR-3 bacterium JGI_Cruoil_03_44_89]|uniref:Acetyl-coenzyme A carboxylase carboxyl transferase subunit alpha n=1 Tax=candidate division WOR-3 bacterium JGI_Cruoil_03_44_89 TaxID=1973748 RepID=A0A235BVF5_UNCW3|nr:MAG: acetyl-CoA carboxylase carboxyl transferase subunit alpha [candidate division WOR-3 bacterium JGI_Cruoil_03_44_89]